MRDGVMLLINGLLLSKIVSKISAAVDKIHTHFHKCEKQSRGVSAVSSMVIRFK